ncbi:uncharacterized protein LOC112089899 [Eutrema salsugineum]|uniref:uncharacterized protein LOC112089899 n=1 Tax=Eutrema salsugineum TaxID=72664 RepID=UPI000CECE4BD|nr:uncharacterized protein LOC112089899 [Eutrema salsugineum]
MNPGNSVWRCFWQTDDANRFSPTVRSMLQLKHRLVDFMRCDIGNGENASFWYDSWTDLGPLISFLGERGPRQLRVRLQDKVIHATSHGEWHLPAARSDQAHALQVTLTTISPPSSVRGIDQYLWRSASGTYVQDFSSKATWNAIRVPAPTVSWYKTVWFKEAIPRFSSHVPLSLRAVDALISSRTAFPSSRQKSVFKLLLQVVVYAIWRERNSRIFTDSSSPVSVVRASVDRMLRDRLLSFPPSTASSPSLLELYFQHLGSIS